MDRDNNYAKLYNTFHTTISSKPSASSQRIRFKRKIRVSKQGTFASSADLADLKSREPLFYSRKADTRLQSMIQSLRQMETRLDSTVHPKF